MKYTRGNVVNDGQDIRLEGSCNSVQSKPKRLRNLNSLSIRSVGPPGSDQCLASSSYHFIIALSRRGTDV